MSKVIKRGQKRSNKLKKDTLDKTMEFFEGDKDLSENVDLYVYGEKKRTAYKKILESRNAFLKAGVSSDRVYKESKEQLEERPLKRKKITKELLKLSKHTHPVSTKEIVGELRKDRRRQVKSKTIFDYAGTLPKLDISIGEAIEKAIEIVAREKGKV